MANPFWSERDSQFPAPPIIPDYELVSRIGGGSYGEVWLARGITGAYRAVKIIHRSTFDHDKPYFREFKGIQKFEPVSRSHDSQLAILHVGQNNEKGCFYYLMELADDQKNGQQINPAHYTPRTLRGELRQRGPLPVPECLELGISLTLALDHLHRHGLIHRDIKPSNIIFVRGLPKLADIGLIAATDETCSLVGTVGYLPPEGAGSPQADLYSLGKVLYEIATGQDRQDFPELPTRLLNQEENQLLVELNEIILKACDQDPGERYASAREMRDDLLFVRQGGSILRRRTREENTIKALSLLRSATSWGLPLLAAICLYIIYSPGPDSSQDKTASTSSGSATPLLVDNFTGNQLSPERWIGGQSDSASSKLYQANPFVKWRRQVENSNLVLEATADHDEGGTVVQHLWTDLNFNLLAHGDLTLRFTLKGAVRNGRLVACLTDGSRPGYYDKLQPIAIEHVQGYNFEEANLASTEYRVDILPQARLAKVFANPLQPESFFCLNLPGVPRLMIRFMTFVYSSAGFRSGQSSMKLSHLRIDPKQGSPEIILDVLDAVTGVGIGGVCIVTDHDRSLGLSGASGFAALPWTQDLNRLGTCRIYGRKTGYSCLSPIAISLADARAGARPLLLKKEQFELGDAVESWPLPWDSFHGMAINGDNYYFSYEEKALYKVARARPRPDAALDIWSESADTPFTSMCLGQTSLWGMSQWPGRVCAVESTGLIPRGQLFGTKGNQLNWPKGCAFDGRYLWFLDQSWVDHQYGLCALETNQLQLVHYIPCQDHLLRGLAWDGCCFWISSMNGRVYEIDPGPALEQGFLEGGTKREFKGRYDHLCYSGGFLWGYNPNTKKLCKIYIPKSGQGTSSP